MTLSYIPRKPGVPTVGDLREVERLIAQYEHAPDLRAHYMAIRDRMIAASGPKEERD